jgi:NADH-quinone oxidoreductase subunit A
MEHLVPPILPIFLFVICSIGLAVGLLVFARIVRPGRPGRVTRMPYESGMDPIHDTRRRFDVRFYLLAIAFLVFDVELLFLYPWAVVAGEARGMGTSVPIESGADPSTTKNDRVGEGERGRLGDGKLSALSSSTSLPLSPSPPLRNSFLGSKNASTAAENRHLVFAGVMTFVALLTLGFVYDWRKGVFQWR